MTRESTQTRGKFRAAAVLAVLLAAGSVRAEDVEPPDAPPVPAPEQVAPREAPRPAPTAVTRRETEYVERAFHIGVGLGILMPDADTAFDTSFYFDVRFTVEYRDLTEIEIHLTPAVTFETDSDIGGSAIDVDSNVISLNVKSYFTQRGAIDVYSRIGIGWMSNDDTTFAEVSDGVVIPIALGINYEAMSEKLKVGLELGHWITDAEIAGGIELDTSMIIATVSYQF